MCVCDRLMRQLAGVNIHSDTLGMSACTASFVASDIEAKNTFTNALFYVFTCITKMSKCTSVDNHLIAEY